MIRYPEVPKYVYHESPKIRPIATDLYKMKLKLRMFGGKITRVSINICTTMENKRGEAWTHEETVLLIELWGDQRVQKQLENMPKRNLEIF